MIDLTSAQSDALAARSVAGRMFVRIDASPAPRRFWNDVGQRTVSSVTYGPGLVLAETLAAGSELAIAGLSVMLDGVDETVQAMIAGDTIAQRGIDVDFGLHNPSTHALIGSLIPMFRGKVDMVERVAPSAGGEAVVRLTCESVSRALTIRGTATRTLGASRERDPDDLGFVYTAIQSDIQIYWGRVDPHFAEKIAAQLPKPGG